MLEAFILMGIHFVADFIFQDEEWAVNKSKSNEALLKHTITYSMIWMYIVFILNILGYISDWFFLFPIITFIAHTITDYFTSRVNSKLYAKGKFGSTVPNLGFFTSLGFDQLLHAGQLFWTYSFLNSL
jgi:hypothetical protein